MGTRCARYPDNAKILAAAEEIERRLSTEPGVAAVGATSPSRPGISPALGARRLEGRWLNAFDGDTSPKVTLVNEALATRYFRGQDAPGKRISLQPANRQTGLVHDRRRRRRHQAGRHGRTGAAGSLRPARAAAAEPHDVRGENRRAGGRGTRRGSHA